MKIILTDLEATAQIHLRIRLTNLYISLLYTYLKTSSYFFAKILDFWAKFGCLHFIDWQKKISLKEAGIWLNTPK